MCVSFLRMTVEYVCMCLDLDAVHDLSREVCVGWRSCACVEMLLRIGRHSLLQYVTVCSAHRNAALVCGGRGQAYTVGSFRALGCCGTVRWAHGLAM